jgi:hypothetical protein
LKLGYARSCHSIAWVTSVVLLTLPGPILAACGQGSGSGSGSGGSNRSTGPLVKFKRAGGLAGRIVTVEVARTGNVSVRPSGRPFKLKRRELGALKRAISKADLAHLPRESRANPPVADGFEYSVIASGRTVYAQDGAVPARLQPLLDRLNGFVARGSA